MRVVKLRGGNLQTWVSCKTLLARTDQALETGKPLGDLSAMVDDVEHPIKKA